jgi:hypothetical protein
MTSNGTDATTMILGDFCLFLWKGDDCLPGTGTPGGQIKLLGKIPVAKGATAEGLAIQAESDSDYAMIIVCDGPAGGDAKRYVVSKP